MAVTPDGTRIITGANDKTTRIWDARTFAEIARLDHPGQVSHLGAVSSVALTLDGVRIVTGSDDGAARIWELFPAGQALIEQAKSLAPRCLTAEHRQRFHLAAAPPGWCKTMQKWPAVQ